MSLALKCIRHALHLNKQKYQLQISQLSFGPLLRNIILANLNLTYLVIQAQNQSVNFKKHSFPLMANVAYLTTEMYLREILFQVCL